jgi:hypothetical protein
MSFTPIMAQVASLKYTHRVNTNNLILVGFELSESSLRFLDDVGAGGVLLFAGEVRL